MKAKNPAGIERVLPLPLKVETVVVTVTVPLGCAFVSKVV
jgi:hypothetical protein